MVGVILRRKAEGNERLVRQIFSVAGSERVKTDDDTPTRRERAMFDSKVAHTRREENGAACDCEFVNATRV